MLLKGALRRLLPSDQYISQKTKKTQIVLHHTVSDSLDPTGDISWWRATKDRVGAHFIVCGDGKVYQCVDTEYWLHHLGVSIAGNNVPPRFKERNLLLNQGSVAIELDNGGALSKKGDAFLSSFGKVYEEKDVVTYSEGYRGYKYFERYTTPQIEGLRGLIIELVLNHTGITGGGQSGLTGPNSRFGYSNTIPFDEGQGESIFDVNFDALGGLSGVYTHASYRTDKSDCHPQSELIEMLRSL